MPQNDLHDRVLDALAKRGIDAPEHRIADARYHMGSDDWYVRDDRGTWSWWDPNKRVWAECPSGPLRAPRLT